MWGGHTDRSRALAQCVADAIDALGWKREYAAALMQISPAQLTRQLAGLEHLSALRLAELPDDFQREYDRRRASLRGGVVLEAPDLSLIRGFVQMPRKQAVKMLRVELPLQRREQAS